ncbi:MAG: protein BatD [Candidatus Omnitrophica bacterium]|nr:protein BatD [Candidatus Omnitrophota bacterium]
MQKYKNNFLYIFAFWSLIFNFLIYVPTSFAEEIKFEASIDRTRVSLGASLQLNLSFYGAGDIPRPDLPDIEGFDWRYLGPSTRMSIINRSVSSSITHIYTLIPLKTGKFKIPSFTVQHKGNTFTTEPISIEVVPGQVALPQEEQSKKFNHGIQGLDDKIFLILQVDQSNAYVNEIIPLTVKLYINNLSIRDIQYPEFTHEGFSIDEFVQPLQYREVFEGISYNVIEFNTNVFAMRPGELKLGPARLKCNLVLKKRSKRKSRSSFFDDDFFDSDAFRGFFGFRYEKHPLNLGSIDIPFTIMPLPEEYMPDSFNGALGNYKFYLEADPKEVNVGDPITLKMTITGNGNFKTIKSPSLDTKDDFKVYDPEIRQIQSGKIFEHVLIPRNEKVSQIPKVSFSFFDPESREYKEITRGPIAVKVNPSAGGEELKVFGIPEEGTGIVRRKEMLGRDIIYIKDRLGRLKRKGKILSQNKPFLIIQFIPLFVIISVLIFQRRKARLEADIPYARRLRAPGKAKKNLAQARHLLNSKEPNKFFDTVFKTLQEYLGDKFHLPTVGITSNVIDDLQALNIDKQILDRLSECFNHCDRARYAPASITREQMRDVFKLLEEVIDRFEGIKG